jgi:adenine deaminase
MKLTSLISVARGDDKADLLLKNARIINTFTGKIEKGNVAIYQERIAGIGDYTQAKQIIDLKGDYLAPGLINGHSHIESSMLHPARYAQAVVPRGTLAVITDLHEIANVSGIKGLQYIISCAQKLPLDMFLMVPSCVPATDMETSGASIDDKDINQLLKLPGVIGLGEVMNFPGVISGNQQVTKKISAAHGKAIDGHAPGLSGKNLNAYLVAGIRSDHECTTLAEAREKLALGMHIMIREGSSEKNLDTLLPLVNNTTQRRCFFVVDDRSCSDLLRDGDIDAVVRKAITRGLSPVSAIQMATINTAEYFRLFDYGGIGPGYMANLITLTDLKQLAIDMVFHKGNLAAREGKYLLPLAKPTGEELYNTMHVKPFNMSDLKLKTDRENFPVIEIIPEQIITRKILKKIAIVDGIATIDIDRDILKLVVVERHRSTGNIGVALVTGFGLKRGALASSVAHDSHNIISVGTSDSDIFYAIKEVEKLGGGLVACVDGAIKATLPLPLAGLLSPEPLEAVVTKMNFLNKSVSQLGNLPPSPFALLSFLALPVIPELKLTDKGLVDVVEFKLLS